MDRNQINRGSMGARLRSRGIRQMSGPSRPREEWSDPSTRSCNVSLRGAEFRRFARIVERDLNPRGPLEQIVTRYATRAAWVLQDREGTSLKTEGVWEQSSAARTLKISIATLDLLQGRRPAARPSANEGVLSGPVADFEAEGWESNEWPNLPICPEDRPVGTEGGGVEDEAVEPPIWHGRLVFDFEVSGTSPVVRGTWVTVSRIVSLIVDGATWADILRSHPELTEDDIRVCVAYAVAEDDSGL